MVGLGDGRTVGLGDGAFVGPRIGLYEGVPVLGNSVGSDEGSVVGLAVG